MSGLFLNFYQVEINTKTVSIKAVGFNHYASKEAFLTLKEKFKNLSFYRDDDKILLLQLLYNLLFQNPKLNLLLEEIMD